MRYRMWALGLAVVIGGFSGGGCATIVSGPTQQVTFHSIPAGATVTVVERHPFPFGTPHPDTVAVMGVTPLTTLLERKESPSIVAQFSKPGYRSMELPLRTRLNPWFWGNFVFGGFLGLTTDIASGASGEYSPNQFFVTLQPEGSTPIEGHVSLAPPEQIRIFILTRHKDLLFDLSRGFGEDLASLLSLLSVTEENRHATSDRLRTLARTYRDPLVFADHVLHLEIAAK